MTDLCAIRLSVVRGLGIERKNSWAPGPITLLGAKVTEGGALVCLRLQFFVRCAAHQGTMPNVRCGQLAGSGSELSGRHMALVRDWRHRIA